MLGLPPCTADGSHVMLGHILLDIIDSVDVGMAGKECHCTSAKRLKER